MNREDEFGHYLTDPQTKVVICSGELAGVGHIKEAIVDRRTGKIEIVRIKAVGYQLDRRCCHLTELFLNQRGHGNHNGSIVQNLLLQFLMLCRRMLGQAKMLEIKNLGPGVPEICYPRDAGRKGDLAGDKMHGMRRAGTYNYVYRMLFQVIF